MEEQAVSNPRDGSLLLQDVSAAARCGSPADPPPRSRDGGSPVSRSLVAAARAVRPPTGAGRPAVGLPFGRADAPSRGGRCNLRRAAPRTAATGSGLCTSSLLPSAFGGGADDGDSFTPRPVAPAAGPILSSRGGQPPPHSRRDAGAGGLLQRQPASQAAGKVGTVASGGGIRERRGRVGRELSENGSITPLLR